MKELFVAPQLGTTFHDLVLAQKYARIHGLVKYYRVIKCGDSRSLHVQMSNEIFYMTKEGFLQALQNAEGKHLEINTLYTDEVSDSVYAK